MNFKFSTLLLSTGLLLSTQGRSQGLVNTGKMYIKGDQASTVVNIDCDWLNSGDNVAIDLNGNVLLSGNYIHGVTTGSTFTDSNNSNYVAFTNPKTAQRIGIVIGGESKDLKHISFPNLSFTNPNTVSVDPLIRIKTNEVKLVQGKVILESMADGARTSITSNLLAQKVSYPTGRTDAFAPSNTTIQVNLNLGGNHEEGRLVGFSSPFKKMYADYFTYNFLSKPSPLGLFGDTGNLISDPTTTLVTGAGYILGMGIVNERDYPNYYTTDIDPKAKQANAADRAKEQFTFARNTLPTSFRSILMASNSPDMVQGEDLNTSDVVVSLDKQGFHYVGNPFMAPIDMSSFLVATNDNTNPWKVSRSADGSADMRSNYYVMSEGTGQYFPQNTYSKFKFTVSYLVGQLVGSTTSQEPATSNLIAPMQMFVVGKNKDGRTNFVIPASARTVETKTSYLRSAIPTVVDEVLLQVTDEDTKSYDRVAIVLRNGASLNATDQYDAGKIFNYSKGLSQIYTKSTDGKNLTSNVIPVQTKSVDLYLDPASTNKTSVISAHRLQSLKSTENLFLEDKKTKQVVDLLQNPTYRFTSTPNDDANRFVVHFTRMTTGVEDAAKAGQISVMYAEQTIQISGLDTEDYGSNVVVTNMQGSTLLKTQINQTPEMSIDCPLMTGVYIVKIAGKNNYSTKIIAK